ncbi:hypothetical protein Z517_09338 [Fonsecaea pedrosoi CBS 271.37]|uniref:Uncharacterized protein n=1 Tax=Fonsecaea pedrosoi CBS 271.37 TaxID=1442368 RepID=A0A0D2GX23_9EURO|nr:uncharacterized protein Z517_09338 [Fonsecaea pedrosoi CBS 271.37]KIW76894.1 hypothetical protein Z517_09338 [Fonsecaea pedrosoi CBS 271.37]
MHSPMQKIWLRVGTAKQKPDFISVTRGPGINRAQGGYDDDDDDGDDDEDERERRQAQLRCLALQEMVEKHTRTLDKD